jgi:minor extracellular serine protease Vpr
MRWRSAAVVPVTVLALVAQAGAALAAAPALSPARRAAITRGPLAGPARGQQSVPRAAADRPLDSSPAGGLAVYTTPDPTPAGSAAYIYSPATLAAAPAVLVTGPGGRRYRLTAALNQSAPPAQWWLAPLPHGPAGIYQVKVSATTAAGAQVSGGSAYEVVSTGQAGPAGQRWTAVGPAVNGGLFAVDAGHPRSMYLASGLAAELFTSHDGGHSWQMERTLPVAGGYPTALLALPGRPGRLVLAVNGGNGLYTDDPTYTGKVLESSDGGAHWRDLGLPDSFVQTLLATPDGSTLVAVTKQGIDITRDQGASWTHLDVPWTTDVSQASLAGGDLYIATLSGLYVVRDVAGDPAAPVLDFTPPGQTSAWVDGVTGDAHAVYAAGWKGGGIYVSRDSGATWTHVYDAPGQMLMFQDVGGTVYGAASNTIVVGTDSGANWTTWPEPVPNIYNQDAVAAGHTLYLGTWDTGIFSTSDQGQHFQWLGGVPDINAYGVAVATGPGGGEIIAGTDSNTYRASAAAAAAGSPAAWGPPAPQVAVGGITPLVAASPDHSVIYKVRSGPRIGTYTIYASHDAGATWKQLGVTQYGNPGALLVDPADPSELFVAGDSQFGGSTLLRSTDGGATWTTVSVPAPVTALAGDPSDPQRLWLGGPDGLWTSAHRGAKLVQLRTRPVTAIAALPGGRLVVGGSGLAVSSDGGVRFRTARLPALDLSVSALAASPGSPGTLYAATGAFHDAGLLKGGHGVYRSTDGGRSWQPFSAGLTDRDVLSLAFSPDGRTLYAGLQRGGVAEIPVSRGHRG